MPSNEVTTPVLFMATSQIKDLGSGTRYFLNGLKDPNDASASANIKELSLEVAFVPVKGTLSLLVASLSKLFLQFSLSLLLQTCSSVKEMDVKILSSKSKEELTLF